MLRFLAIFFVVSTAACRDNYIYHGVPVSPMVAAAPIDLTRHGGAKFSLAREKGRVVLVFFGYTHCPDFCPATLGDWQRVKSALGENADQVRFVFVTVDPKRDSAHVVQEYVSNFDKSFIGLSGDSAQLAEIAQSYGVSSFVEGSHRSHVYSVAHPSRVYLIDTKGRLRFMYTAGTPTAELVQDIRHILRG